jgi:hypothetical protein
MNKKFITIGFLLILIGIVFAGSYVVGNILTQNEFNSINLNNYDFEEALTNKTITDDALVVTFTIESFEKDLNGGFVVVDKNIELTYWKERYYNCRADNNLDFCMSEVNKNFLDRLDFLIKEEKLILDSWKTTSDYDSELLTIDTYYMDLEVYEVGKNYIIGDSFMYDNKAYEVIQAHTSQANWIPSELPALYKYKSLSTGSNIAEWVQPTGASDAYNIGDQVTYNGSTYESLINANVWSPVAYPAGWQQI